MARTIIDLFSAVGAENINIQLVHKSILGAKQRKGYVAIELATDKMTPGELIGAPRNIGFVCWVDREKYEEAVAVMEEVQSDAPRLVAAEDVQPGHWYWFRPRADMPWSLMKFEQSANVYAATNWQYVGPVYPPKE